jgi:hypothetical protein
MYVSVCETRWRQIVCRAVGMDIGQGTLAWILGKVHSLILAKLHSLTHPLAHTFTHTRSVRR